MSRRNPLITTSSITDYFQEKKEEGSSKSTEDKCEFPVLKKRPLEYLDENIAKLFKKPKPIDEERERKLLEDKQKYDKDYVNPYKRRHSAVTYLDNVNPEWLKKPIKKQRIDNSLFYNIRMVTHIPSAQVLMGKSEAVKYLTNPSPNSYHKILADAMGIRYADKIIKHRVDIPPEKQMIGIKGIGLIPRMKRPEPPSRNIMKSPISILDSPGLLDDYYTNCMDWSSRNTLAVALGRSIFLWNADSTDIVPLKYEDDVDVTSISWSTDGKILSVGTETGETQVWDVTKNVRLRSMCDRGSRVNSLSWNKHLVTSGAENGTIWHHDVRASKHKVKELTGHTDNVIGLKWRDDGEYLASGGNDGLLNIYDVRNTKPHYSNSIHEGSAVKAIAWCPWNRGLLATGGGTNDKNIRIWNANLGTVLNTVYTGSQVTSLHWSHHFKELVTTHGSPHNVINVWEYPTLKKAVEIPAHDARILHSALSNDGQTLATVSTDCNLKLWKVFDAENAKRLPVIDAVAAKQQEAFRRVNSLR
ncbi:WD40-repeat-containing domain protein [Pilobolus umbonatus]|nr:WD40-repeat-containing domain protein [Pilobolus umbonatus]